MAYFLLQYQYADLEARARTREAHLDYLRSLKDQGKLVAAGPMADTSGATVVYVADSVEEVQAMVDGDPYTPAGVGTGHTIKEWSVTVSVFG